MILNKVEVCSLIRPLTNLLTPMHHLSVILTMLLTASAALAQTPDPRDVSAIKNQCGCHEVDFRYAETFSPDKAYAFKDRYQTKGTE